MQASRVGGGKVSIRAGTWSMANSASDKLWQAKAQRETRRSSVKNSVSLRHQRFVANFIWGALCSSRWA